MKIGNITIEMPKDKITADDISKKILENKDVKRIPESDIDTQLK